MNSMFLLYSRRMAFGGPSICEEYFQNWTIEFGINLLDGAVAVGDDAFVAEAHLF